MFELDQNLREFRMQARSLALLEPVMATVDRGADRRSTAAVPATGRGS